MWLSPIEVLEEEIKLSSDGDNSRPDLLHGHRCKQVLVEVTTGIGNLDHLSNLPRSMF